MVFVLVYLRNWNSSKKKNKMKDIGQITYAIEVLESEIDYNKSAYKQDIKNKQEYSKRVIELKRALTILREYYVQTELIRLSQIKEPHKTEFYKDEVVITIKAKKHQITKQ